MQVRVRLFAALRERAGTAELELELPDGALVADALERMRGLTDGVPVVMAVNQEYADVSSTLHGGDEVALIPPISGGAVGALHARLTTEPLALDPLVELVRDPRAGAVVSFLGVTREVAELEYEAYAEMAERQMTEIVAARDRAPRSVRGGGRAPRRHRAAVGAVGRDRGFGPAPRRGVRGGARDHRRDQGPGADLEEGGGRMGARGDGGSAALRSLPAVHELAAALDAPHVLAVAAARRAIDEHRAAIRAGAPVNGDLLPRARELLAELERPSLRRVVNATGVILHTNLGRAPLSASARDAVARAAEGYSNLELELDTGERGSRHAHVERLLCDLTGAEAAIVVNNGAGAVLLAAAAIAGPGKAIVVARGQLVEIGGGFRIPEVIVQSGARLVEVGTTNRTRIGDYARALETHDDIGAIMRVHQSNFRTVGFVEEVPIEALCKLAVPVIDDVGSGWLAGQPGKTEGTLTAAEEPPLTASVAAGAALVCCSGDKLLGGPQAGLIVGRRDAVATARRHPLARALRIDKLSLAALDATLRLYLDPDRALEQIPVLAMLAADEDTLAARARRLAAAIGDRARVTRATGKVGGGALPLLELEGPVVALDSEPEALARALRHADPPVIARISDGQVLLDPRTLTDADVEPLAVAVRSALADG